MSIWHYPDIIREELYSLSRLALKIVVIARQEARGKSKEVFSDFTFLYTVWFYCVHLLRKVFNVI
ncbi:MAG: hypothetical protein HEQ13_25405 [Dolichospermum sp. DEX189]|nr:hypothetical protein [Dolichospermum sp. DEX189]